MPYKLYASILVKQLTAIMKTILLEAMHGFRKCKSGLVCIFIIAQVIEKHREYQLPTCITFIDLGKTFDRVNRDWLWTIM